MTQNDSGRLDRGVFRTGRPLGGCFGGCVRGGRRPKAKPVNSAAFGPAGTCHSTAVASSLRGRGGGWLSAAIRSRRSARSDEGVSSRKSAGVRGLPPHSASAGLASMTVLPAVGGVPSPPGIVRRATRLACRARQTVAGLLRRVASSTRANDC